MSKKQHKSDSTNPNAQPKLKKIIINMGTGDLLKNTENKDSLIRDLTAITGQKPKVQKARISVSSFGVREGNLVGLTVTLRSKRMQDFFQRLVTITLPRIRDFRGVPTKSFDGRGNYTLGLVEYSIFPEIDLTKLVRPHGMEITIVTSAGDNDRARQLLTDLGMPFEKSENVN